MIGRSEGLGLEMIASDSLVFYMPINCIRIASLSLLPDLQPSFFTSVFETRMPPLIEDTHTGSLLFTVGARRVICLSSVAHHLGCADWESAVGGHVGHWQRSTYPDSKLAMVLFAKVRAAEVDMAFVGYSPHAVGT